MSDTHTEIRARIRLANETAERAAMQQARRVGLDVGVRDGTDFGPSSRGGLVIEDRRDLDDTVAMTKRNGRHTARTIHAARVRCNLMALYRARPRSVELHHVQAGYLWQYDREIGLEGAMPPRDVLRGGGGDARESPDPEAMRLNAVRRFRNGGGAIIGGGDHLRCAIYYILKPVTVAECAAKYRISNRAMTDAVAAALELLAVQYGVSAQVTLELVDPLAP